MGEIRPWLDSYISVGQFITLRDLNLIDCSVLHGARWTYYREEPSADEREKAVWAQIDHAFSVPFSENEVTAEYVPTQVLGEVFRQHGYDGIIYKSLLGKGHNVALFRLDDAMYVKGFLCGVKSIKHDFEEVRNIKGNSGA